MIDNQLDTSYSNNKNMLNFFNPETNDLDEEKEPHYDFLEIPLLNDSISSNHYPRTPNDNDAFLNYFMKIDYTTEFFPSKLMLDPTNSECEIQNDPSTTLISSLNALSKKTQRANDDNVIIDELTKTVYNKNDDINAYRKAKKRIQNRESALRMKKLKQEKMIKIDDKIQNLQKENKRLTAENLMLKKEKIFLIDQIKSMQNILKESNIQLNHSNGNIQEDLNEKNTFKYENNILFYNGSKQKLKGKLFNVFVICLLSMIYIAGEYSSFSNIDSPQLFQNPGTIKLNSIKESSESMKLIWSITSKLILVTLVLLIIPWVKTITSLISSRKNQKFE